MSPPNKISAPLAGIYDEEAGVCRMVPEEEAVCMAEPTVSAPIPTQDAYLSRVSRSQLLADAFGPARRVNPLLSESPTQYSPWAILTGLTGCSGPAEPSAPGDPIRSATPLGAELVMNPQPLRGNLDGVDLSGAASQSSVVWSVFDSTTPANTGTFAFLRSGTSGGSVFQLSNETSARHLTTTGAT
ncbi:MAG: hypothetical protein K8R69_04765, partial [Deltaproteobacteria bacterium]|nr:hypothetical protein [Deltaproteobacteria bacterium]